MRNKSEPFQKKWTEVNKFNVQLQGKQDTFLQSTRFTNIGTMLTYKLNIKMKFIKKLIQSTKIKVIKDIRNKNIWTGMDKNQKKIWIYHILIS